MFVIRTYKYKGFDVEEMEGGTYRLGSFQYKTLREVVSQINRHLEVRLKQLMKEQETILDGRCTSKAWHDSAQNRINQIQEAINKTADLLHDQP